MSNHQLLKTEADTAFKAGQLSKAIDLYSAALEAKPDWAAAHNNLAMVLRQQGDAQAAEAHFRASLDSEPDLVGALSNFGALLLEQSRLDEAEELLTRANNLQNENAGVAYNLGLLAIQHLNDAEAVQWFERATSLNPKLAVGFSNLGAAQRRLGLVTPALENLRKAIALEPNLFEAYLNLAMTLTTLGDHQQARTAGLRAVELRPDSPDAHYRLGNINNRIPDFEAAVQHFNRVLSLDPAHEEAANNRARPLTSLGQRTEAYRSFETALKIDPHYAATLSNLILFKQYDPDVAPEALYAEARAWNDRFAQPVSAPVPQAQYPVGDRPLNVGYLSPHFTRHPVGYFVEPVLRYHDDTAVKATCYADMSRPDDQSEKLHTHATAWHDVSALGHDALADRIRADGIDILIDLDGHSGPNRLPVFARRAAPLQITWAGYVGTTGLDAMDYLITDRRQTVDADLHLMTEQPVFMPGNYVTLAPIEDAPDIAPNPSAENGHVTFGCFNALDKINPHVVALWSDILNAVPDSRLKLITFDLGDAAVRTRIETLFAEHGVQARCLDLRGKVSRADLLSAYNTIDIALDPFPYSGGLTTLEALWMGVPVITRRDGDRFAARHSTTHLTAVGLTECIAENVQDYVARATALASNPDRRNHLRETLRGNMRISPVCDGVGFTRALEKAYRIMWQRHCAGDMLSPIMEDDLTV